MIEKHLTYRGDIRAITSIGNQLAFVTQHAGRVPTALYRLGPDKAELTETPLESGGLAILAAGENLLVAGDDAALYEVSAKAKKPKKITADLPASATALVSLEGKRIGALCGPAVVILDAKGKLLQTLPLPDDGSALAADPTGQWFAAGTTKGDVTVFECEDKSDFQSSETAKLHGAAVTAILFEPEELRFLTAGADQKLLLTHARGKLEPEDRGRGACHKKHVTAMLHVPGERFVSASQDGAAKSWALAGATRPATFEDGVVSAIDATLVEIHARPHVALACEDNTIRLFLLDAGGRFSSASHRFYDAMQRARTMLESSDVSQRGEALHDLSGYADAASVEMLAKHLASEHDAKLRLRATQLLVAAKHPRVVGLLKPLLNHADEHVRMEAFEGLRSLSGKNDLTPIQLAIDAAKTNIGTVALDVLTPLAKKDSQARQLMIRTLDKEPAEVRRAAMLSLEKVFNKTSPEPSLIAAASDRQDVRRLALIRMYQRDLLKNARVTGTVRRMGEDADADVRRTAFLVSLLSNEKLALAVRQQDQDLHRGLHELETFTLEIAEPTKKKGQRKDKAESEESGAEEDAVDAKAQAKAPPKSKKTAVRLKAEDYGPLLTAMSSRMRDTCLLGARALAQLGDARAFGTLLQLSRENSPQLRGQVCRALQSLGDARALQRLDTLIHDEDASVRDAAFTAIESLRASQMLDAAEVGLSSKFSDVRSRGLQSLVKTLRKSKAKGDRERGAKLMLRALNDEDPKLRGEGFKASLNLEIAGKGIDTLRFVLGSSHASVRREVLTEAMAHDKEPWAVELLHDLFDDPDPQIRADSLEHLSGLSKGKDIEPMKAALRSKFPDIRLTATNLLIARKTRAAQEGLVPAIADEDKEIRLAAISAIVQADAVEILQAAMESKFTDVRIAAASARAKRRDPKSAAPLLAIVLEAPPVREDEHDRWEENVVDALAGLTQLQLPEHVPQLLPLCHVKQVAIRRAAAIAIAFSMTADQSDLVIPILQDDNESVKYLAALGLARGQHEIALPLIFSEQAAAVLCPTIPFAILVAACAYGDQTEDRVAEQLDSSETWISNAAMLVLLARDLRDHDGTPRRILLALGCRSPRLRLWAAKALEAFGSTEAFTNVITRFINDRGAADDWDVDASVIETMMNLLSFGDPGCTTWLSPLTSSLQQQFDDQWKTWSEIWPEDVEGALAANTAAAKKLGKIKVDQSELKHLAFGTYVGLVREQGSGSPSFGTTVLSVRQAALRRLIELAADDASVRAATIPVVVQTLGDPQRDLRALAFEKLVDLGFDDAARASAALECGHNDLAVDALKLLAQAGGSKGSKILEEVILDRDDRLAFDVAQVLSEMLGVIAASESILQSPSSAARRWCVQRLANEWETESQAGDKLAAAAAGSLFDDVRLSAACALASQKHSAAFDCLVPLLDQVDSAREQSQVVRALVEVGDERTSDVLLDAVENDTRKRLDVTQMFAGVRDLRDPAAAPRVLSLLDDTEGWQQKIGALLYISGYDQANLDPRDERTDRDWLEKQFPRHDDVLAQLIEKLNEIDKLHAAKHLIDCARWSLTSAVDPILAILSVHPDDAIRTSVIEAIGWRRKHRDGPGESLHSLLEHRDVQTRFLAAEGLALAGDAAGISVLMSTVELVDDLSLRSRALKALGELSDARAWDLLLRLASDDGHALQQVAAEAIGHLGTTDRREEIFELLKRILQAGGSAARGAIIGLRWLNVPEGWALIRAGIDDHSLDMGTALRQLGFNDTPETRDLLLRQVAESQFFNDVIRSALRVFGDDSLDLAYQALKRWDYIAQTQLVNDDFGFLKRVCEHGAPTEIFELLKENPIHSVRVKLESELLSRNPLPVEAASAALDCQNGGHIDAPASVLGRSGDPSHGDAIAAAMSKWFNEWETAYKASAHSGWSRKFDRFDNSATFALERLCWAAGRTSAAKKELMKLVLSHVNIHEFQSIRVAATSALGEIKLTKTDLNQITPLTDDPNGEIRLAVAMILSRADAARGVEIAKSSLSDRRTFASVSASQDVDASSAIKLGLPDMNYQGVVLPGAVAAAEVESLSEVASDANLNENTRLGAIEGLAKIASEDAEKHLIAMGQDEANHEDLRKAAWRGLRRSKRLRAKAVS